MILDVLDEILVLMLQHAVNFYAPRRVIIMHCLMAY